MAVQYRIGEFAQLAGVSVKTLRFYDEIGLLRPAGVDSRTRYRHYMPRQLEDLASIAALKELGVALSEIRALLSKSGTKLDRQSLLMEVKRRIERSIRSASQSLQWVNAALADLDGSKPVTVVVKRRQAMQVASMRATVKHYAEIQPLEQALLKALPEHSLAKQRGVLWHSCADSGTLEGEPFVALKQQVSRNKLFEVKNLPAATLACAYSDLDDEDAERAYRALNRWLSLAGYRLEGPKREIYLGEMLEIQFPIA